ncbi:MAG: alpha/beta fold hydrolase [Flavobacteriales bacterium]|nr:alpha/beta fold hydrolase [Flavobacteriales bacterium]MCW8912200.1 alpha/beta fold hydrolase [Flavobacteriales bacterium]MCW8940081.1 alpha/beta fold hydrolase [Flavobacteriales bacterium]MCW8967053.1 alpha/beta fold hydrolase [Flavobacteriales bacterium]MCW8990739.1 alpha/beta fold hydrolase [Flavobacteriales bacterium]
MKNLLILHGAIGSKSQFNSLASLLNNQFNIHLLNFSGHGGEVFKENFNIPQFADDVLVYLEQQKIEAIDIFGYSMGGYVALYLAKHHPEKVGKIITLGTKLSWTPEIAAKETKMLVADKIEEKIPAFAAILKDRHYPNDWKIVLEKTANMMIAMGNKNVLKDEEFKLIQHPVKMLLADQDEMVSKTETNHVAQLLPHATFELLPNSKHPIEKVDIDALSEIIRAFYS